MKIQMVKGQLMILARTKYSSQNQQALRLERLCCPLLQALGYVWSKTERECMGFGGRLAMVLRRSPGQRP